MKPKPQAEGSFALYIVFLQYMYHNFPIKIIALVIRVHKSIVWNVCIC